ncbi:MAG TPA: hypothetical protein VLJ17_04375 [Xanthobacteraceae bacterium]|nr:hypothetical protein [Xanthobacteraceae bacterium]
MERILDINAAADVLGVSFSTLRGPQEPREPGLEEAGTNGIGELCPA